MKTAAFIDGNWLLHRNYLTLGKQSAFPEKTLPLRMLDSCSKFALRLKADHSALVFDGPNNFRYKIFPAYKANRSGVTHSGEIYDENYDASPKEDIYKHLIGVQDLFQSVGFPCFQYESFEADDMVAAGSHAFALRGEDRESWIVCRDKDSFQDVRSRVRVFWPEQGKDPERIVTKEEVLKRFGLTPMQFGDYQVLIGDSTDNIPAILQPAKAKKILKEFGSLKKFFKTEEGHTFFYKNEQELRRNTKLIRMDKRCWLPRDEDISLLSIKDSKYAFKSYGRLPDSFNQLRAANKPRQSLFGGW